MNKNRDNNSAPSFDTILLAIDTHAQMHQVTRQIDSVPQPSQRMTEQALLAFAKKQLTLAGRVCAVYEAGPFGFGLCRKLRAMGVICEVVRPKKLDPYHKRVQTDRTDSRELLQDLDRYVRGNRRALAVIHVPTPEQELKRAQARHRDALCKELRAFASRGRTLLLYFGIRASNHWHKNKNWESLAGTLNETTRSILLSYKAIIDAIGQQIRPAEAKLVQAAPKELPKGCGALTFELIVREIVCWQRFKTRRQIGSFTGLCGGVASSGSTHLDFGITKHGHRRLRTLLVELAWRMVRFQAQCRLIQKWKHILLNPKAAKSKRKQAIVAVARQLAVDFWKWQTGKVTPQELGWKMASMPV